MKRQNREGEGYHLSFKQTNTTKEGFTTLVKTGDELTDTALSYLEDALSYLYYHALENEKERLYEGADALSLAKGELEQALELLEEL